MANLDKETSKGLVFKYGHFYEDGKRIDLKDGVELIITTQDKNFESSNIIGLKEKQTMPTLRDKKEIKDILTKKKKPFFFLLEPNNILEFTITTSTKSKITAKYTFKIEILEPLFAVKLSEKRTDLFDCWCKLVECSSGNVQFFEEIYGKSLNTLYKNIYIYYLGITGFSTSNVHDRMTVLMEDKTIKEILLMVKK